MKSDAKEEGDRQPAPANLASTSQAAVPEERPTDPGVPDGSAADTGAAATGKADKEASARPGGQQEKRKKGHDKGRGKGSRTDRQPEQPVWRWWAPERPEPPQPQSLFMTQGDPVLFDVERQSYVFHWKNALPKDACDFAFDKLLNEVPWDELKSKRGFVTRKSCWISGLGQTKCTCGYVYGDTSLPPKSVPFVERLTEVVFGSLFPDLPKKWHPTCVNCNLYEGGEHSCGWHADDEKLFGDGEQDVTIVSLSLGATREFWLTLRKRLGEVNPDEFSLLEMDLEHGDLLTMEGKCQKHTIHMLPRAPCTEPRINLTWRWIRKHSEDCPLVHQNRGAVQRTKPEFVRPRPAVPIWCHGYEVSWGLCDFCQHPGYKNGRVLVPTAVGNVCRHCLPQAQMMVNQNSGWTMTPWGMVPPDMSGAVGVPELPAYSAPWPSGPAGYPPGGGAMPPVMQGW